MGYKKAPKDHTEFGGGPGLIDPQRRKDRNLGTLEETGEALVEIYATNPARPESGLTPANEQVSPLGRENFPETATIERP